MAMVDGMQLFQDELERLPLDMLEHMIDWPLEFWLDSEESQNAWSTNHFERMNLRDLELDDIMAAPDLAKG